MMCDFGTGFQPPEMTKRRPVLTISRARNDGASVCTVIPISSTAPKVIRDFHYLLPENEMPKFLQGKYPENWVKVDMMTTVAFFRLELLWCGRDQHGKRSYQTSAISLEHKLSISEKITSRLYLVALEK